MPQLEEEYIKTGLLKYVFRDLPLERIHKRAFRAAVAASCAGSQEQFWPMHDRLFADQKALAEEDFRRLGSELGLDMNAFESCLADERSAAKVRKDMQESQQASITSTPAFVIGVTEPQSNTITVVGALSGAQPFARFKQTIDALLDKEKE